MGNLLLGGLQGLRKGRHLLKLVKKIEWRAAEDGCYKNLYYFPNEVMKLMRIRTCIGFDRTLEMR